MLPGAVLVLGELDVVGVDPLAALGLGVEAGFEFAVGDGDVGDGHLFPVADGLGEPGDLFRGAGAGGVHVGVGLAAGGADPGGEGVGAVGQVGGPLVGRDLVGV